MDFVKYPELRKALGKLDTLWENRRMAGVHRQDVIDIFINTFNKVIGKDIVVVENEDWSVMYVDGEDKHQGHCVEVEHLIRHTPIRTITHFWATAEYDRLVLQPKGRFPSTLAEYLKGKRELE